MKNLLLIILLSFLSIFVNLYEWKTTNNSIKALSVNADAKRKVIDIHNVNNRRISQRKEGIPTQTGHKTNTISTPLLIESNNNKSTKIDTSKINDNVFCSGDKVTLTADGCEGTVKWSNGQTGSSMTLTLSNDTTYIATCLVIGCGESSMSNSIVIKVNKVAIATASNLGPYNSGDEVKLSGSGGTKYEWTGPASFSSTLQNPLIQQSTVAMSGIYSVKITDANGCSAIAQTNVKINPALANEINESFYFKVFPNPSTQTINVQFNTTTNENVEILLIDLEGKIQISKEMVSKGGKQEENLNLDGAFHGNFVIKILKKDEILTKKVYIE